MAKRIKAETILIAASHVVMLSQPDKVVDLIVKAAG
jgi:hypothetical protein